MNKNLGLIFFSNLAFVSTYALLALHTLFIHQSEASGIKSAVYLGFGIYNALQVGGVWLIELILGAKIGFSIKFVALCRILATSLLFIPNTIAIVAAYTLFGLSSASYYKISRSNLKEILKDTNYKISNPYIVFSISTNVAFIIMPLLGSQLIKIENYFIYGFIINTAMTFVSFLFFKPYRSTTIDTNQAPQNTDANFDQFNIFDAIRVVFFLLPYAIMITMPPIKSATLGLGSENSSYLYIVNGLIIVISQTLLSKSSFFRFSFLKYDVLTVIACLTCFAAYFVNYTVFVYLFILWTITESYQMPAIEYLLFNQRKYSDKTINRILLIDSVICLLGPIISSKVFLK